MTDSTNQQLIISVLSLYGIILDLLTAVPDRDQAITILGIVGKMAVKDTAVLRDDSVPLGSAVDVLLAVAPELAEGCQSLKLNRTH